MLQKVTARPARCTKVLGPVEHSLRVRHPYSTPRYLNQTPLLSAWVQRSIRKALRYLEMTRAVTTMTISMTKTLSVIWVPLSSNAAAHIPKNWNAVATGILLAGSIGSAMVHVMIMNVLKLFLV